MRHYKPYSKYKDSGIEWIGEIPEHWDVKRLRHIAIFKNSNVDKKSYEGQINVKLCNYTDVYYNEFITSNLDFMTATASSTETENFQLQKGDVIITKDSEDPRDIGIPALVLESMNDVVCGYHLSVIRASEYSLSKFIHRSIQDHPTKAHFFVESPGITRYGLDQDAIGDIPVCVPPEDERKLLVNAIDNETTRIDTLISKKTRFVELLKEKRQALITHVVTKGLDPNVKMKDSGIEWIGEVPEGWKVTKLKHLTKLIIDGAHFTPTYTETGIPFLRVTDLHLKTIDLTNVKYIPIEEHKELIKRCKPEKGDLLLSKNGTIGLTKVIDWDWEFSIFVSLCLIKFKQQLLSPYFFTYIFQSSIIEEQLFHNSKKTSVTNLHLDKIKELYFAIPPIEEQEQLIFNLNNSTSRIDTLIDKTQQSIDLLKERRSAFITAAVTGQIDLREE